MLGQGQADHKIAKHLKKTQNLSNLLKMFWARLKMQKLHEVV